MKKIITTFTLIFIALLTFAQSPQMFNYQAVVRDNNGDPIADAGVKFQISILQGSESGSAVYTETHEVTANGQGLVTLKIGDGTTTDDFTTIDWGGDSYFIEVELDPEGGDSFESFGTSQLLSVPYAMHATTAADIDDADADPSNELQDLSVSGNTLSISDGNTVDLPGGHDTLQVDTLQVTDYIQLNDTIEEGLKISNIVELTGITDDTDNETVISMPNGYSPGKVRVLELSIRNTSQYVIGGTWYGLGHSDTNGTIGYKHYYSALFPVTNELIITYPDELNDMPYRVVLMVLQ